MAQQHAFQGELPVLRGGPDAQGHGDRDPETIDAWPTCPECGKKRHTMCPICETAGSDFPPAVMRTDRCRQSPFRQKSRLSTVSIGRRAIVATPLFG